MDVNVTFEIASPHHWADNLLLTAQEAQDLRYARGNGGWLEHRPQGLGVWVVSERHPNGRVHFFTVTAEKLVKAAAYVLQGAEDINLGDGGSRSVHEDIAAAFIFDDARQLDPWTADAVLQRAVFGKVLWSSDPPPLTP
jgi:hypothetical protein